MQTSQVSGIADPVVGQAITAAATKALNTELTEQYLENIYVGFNQVAEQFTNVSDAAAKLADGTEELSGGIDPDSAGCAASWPTGWTTSMTEPSSWPIGLRQARRRGRGAAGRDRTGWPIGARRSASGAGDLADGPDRPG